jgi:hypothetical protein
VCASAEAAFPTSADPHRPSIRIEPAASISGDCAERDQLTGGPVDPAAAPDDQKQDDPAWALSLRAKVGVSDRFASHAKREFGALTQARHRP